MTRKQVAVPILLPPRHEGELYRNGSGFLSRIQGVEYLITAAHGPANSNPPHHDWEAWRTDLEIHDSRKTLSLPLFEETEGGAPVPKFGFSYTTPAGARLHDLIHIDLTRLATEDQILLRSRYQVFETAVGIPGTGAGVTCFGYPDVGEYWPASEPSSVCGTVLATEGPGILMDMDSATGYSGGPVLDNDNRLVGMKIGFKSGDKPPTVAYSSQVIIDMVQWFLMMGSSPPQRL